jgi:hypothetical protein
MHTFIGYQCFQRVPTPRLIINRCINAQLNRVKYPMFIVFVRRRRSVHCGKAMWVVASPAKEMSKDFFENEAGT